MGHVVTTSRVTRRVCGLIFGGLALFALGAVAAGFTALAMAVGGGLMTWGSVIAGWRVVQWFDRPHNDGTELWWDVLIVGIVLLGLTGLGLMALALPT